VVSIDTRAFRADAFVSNDSKINFLTHPLNGGTFAMYIEIKSMTTGSNMNAHQLFTFKCYNSMGMKNFRASMMKILSVFITLHISLWLLYAVIAHTSIVLLVY